MVKINYKIIEDLLLQKNSFMKKEDLRWRADGRLEWVCSHNGMGHIVYSVNGNYTHGCDKCCENVKRLYVQDILDRKYIK